MGKSIPLHYKPVNIVRGHDPHEEEEEGETGGVGRLGDVRLNGAADHRLNEDKKEASAVKRGDWDQVHEGEIDRDERNQREDVLPPESRGRADGTCDTDRARDLREIG